MLEMPGTASLSLYLDQEHFPTSRNSCACGRDEMPLSYTVNIRQGLLIREYRHIFIYGLNEILKDNPKGLSTLSHQHSIEMPGRMHNLNPDSPNLFRTKGIVQTEALTTSADRTMCADPGPTPSLDQDAFSSLILPHAYILLTCCLFNQSSELAFALPDFLPRRSCQFPLSTRIQRVSTFPGDANIFHVKTFNLRIVLGPFSAFDDPVHHLLRPQCAVCDVFLIQQICTSQKRRLKRMVRPKLYAH